jgi:hypothetical protein
MARNKRNEREGLAIGTISILRTLVELDQAGCVNLPFDDFVVAKREDGDPDYIADAIDILRENTVSDAARSRRN